MWSSGERPNSSHTPPSVCRWPLGLTPGSMFSRAPLLLALIVLGPHVYRCGFVDIGKNTSFFRMCVEFAKFQFNQAQPDEYAYKLLWVGRSQRKVSGSLPSLGLHVHPKTKPGRRESLFCRKQQWAF